MANTTVTLADCQARDDADVLAHTRARFVISEGTIYLDGNSLGAMPSAAPARAQEVVTQEWGKQLITSWNLAGWFAMPQRLGDQLAPLIGAAAGEVVVTDSTSVNLYKQIVAALQAQNSLTGTAQRSVIVSERDNFPTDLYMMQGLIRMMNQAGVALRLELIDSMDDLASVLTDEVALVCLTHVNYRSGRMWDMTQTTAQIHAAGALVLWDLAHSAGAVPVDLNGADADFAVGCCYKYLNGGPGAPAFLWIHPRHHADYQQPLTGWWSHAEPFAMSPEYRPTQGVARGLIGTQPMVSLALVECGLDTFADVSMAQIRAKSLALTDLFIELMQPLVASHGLRLVTPLAHAERGSQVSFEFEGAYACIQALIARGIIGDYRDPHIMRFGFTPLYVGFADVWHTVAALSDIIGNELWREPQYNVRHAVT